MIRFLGNFRREIYKDLLTDYIRGLVAQTVKNLPAMLETWVRSPGWKDPLEKGMETYSSILAWRSPWTEDPGGLQSMGPDMTERLMQQLNTCMRLRMPPTGFWLPQRKGRACHLRIWGRLWEGQGSAGGCPGRN